LCCNVKQFELAEGLKWIKRSATDGWLEARYVRISRSRRVTSGGRPGEMKCKHIRWLKYPITLLNNTTVKKKGR